MYDHTMTHPWVILLNMFLNGDSNLQTKLGVHITLNISKTKTKQINKQTNKKIKNPPSNLQSLPYPRVGGGIDFFFLNWGKKMNLQVPGTILPLYCVSLSTRVKIVWGVVTTALWRTRVNLNKTVRKAIISKTNVKHNQYFCWHCITDWVK